MTGNRLVKHSLFACSLVALTTILTTCSLAKVGLGAAVDITVPTATITSPSADGTYASGAISIAGTAKDDIEVKSVFVVYPTKGGTANVAAAVNGSSWSAVIPSGTGGADDAVDGSDSIQVVVTDSSGKSSTMTRLVYVDNKAPMVLVTSPSSYGTSPPAYSDYVDIAGQAYDSSPVSSVTVTLAYTANDVVTKKTQTADGTYAWSSRFLLKDSKQGFLAKSNDGQVLYYQVVVTDQAGNANTYYYHSQDIYTLLSDGTLFPTIKELGVLDQGGTSPSSPSGLLYEKLAEKRLTNATTSGGDLSFTYVTPPTVDYLNLSVSDSTSNVLAPGSVIAGTITPPAGSGSVTQSSLEFWVYKYSDYSTSGAQASAVLDLTAESPGGNNQLTLAAVGSSYSFKISLSDNAATSLATGRYVLRVYAKASGSDTAYDGTIPFSIDSSSPTLTETKIGDALALKRSKFTLGGVVASQSGLGTLVIRQSADGGGTWTDVATTTYDNTTLSASWSQDVTPAADGAYTYSLVFTTATGVKATLYRSVTFDQTGPVLSAIAPTPGSWSTSDQVTISGTASDGSGTGVSKIYYLIDGVAYDHSADVAAWAAGDAAAAPSSGTDAAWKAAGGLTSAWTAADGNAETLPEGLFRVWVVAVDKAGNTSALQLVGAANILSNTTYTILSLGTTNFTAVGAKSNTVGLSFQATGTGSGTGEAWTGSGLLVPFGVDLAPPTLKVDASPASVATATAAAFTGFTGTAADTNPAGPPTLVVAYTKDLVSQPSASPSITGGAWAWDPFGGTVNTATHASDGTYAFQFTATDVAGRITSVSRALTVDTTAPSLTVTSPSAGELITAASYTIRGSALDSGVGLSQVLYKLDTDTAWTTLTSSSWSAVLSLASEGARTLSVKALDKLGNTTDVTDVAFQYDKAAPLLTVSNPATTQYVNATTPFTFAGTWTETNSLASIAITYQKDSSGTDLAFQTLTPNTAGTAVAWSSNPVNALDEGSYVFTFVATDAAGRTSASATRTVVIDKTAPVPTINTIAASGYLSTASKSVSGAFNPADTTVKTVEVKLDSGAWTTALFTSGDPSWSTNLSDLDEGPHTLAVRATDMAGNTSTATVTSSFTVDLAPPTLVDTSLASLSTGYVGADFTLSGQFSDTVGFASPPLFTFELTKDNVAQTVAVTPVQTQTSPSTWTYSYTVNLGSVTSGTYKATINVKDASGQAATTLVKSVSVDRVLPTVSITSPTGSGYLSGNAYVARGTSFDADSGVSSLVYQVDGKAWTAMTVSDNWTINLDLTNSGAANYVAEGSHTLAVQATDKAGNVGVVQSVTFMVDQNPPTLTESGVAGAGQASDAASSAIVKTGFTLGGTVADTNALASPPLTVGIDGAAPVALGSLDGTTYVTTSGSPWSLQVATGVGHLGDGVHTFVFTATDVAGRTSTLTRTVTVDTTAPTISPEASSVVADTTVKFAGTAGDNVALAKVEYQIGSTTGAWTAATGTDSWSASVNFASTAEGVQTLYFRATDTAGWTQISPVTVNVDHTNPRADFAASTGLTLVGDLKSAANTFTLKGVADDAGFTAGRPAASAVLTYSKDGGTSVSATGLVFSAAAGTWSWAKTVDTAGHTDDGLYVFTLTVTDNYAKTTSVSQTVKVDSTAPSLTVTSPTAGELVSTASYTIRGSALDSGVGLSQVLYKLDTDTAWTTLTSSSWSAVLSLASEGTRTLSVKALDKLGNTTDVTDVAFQYDKAAPLLTVSNPATTQYVNATTPFTFAGTWTETNSLASIAITYQKDSSGTDLAFQTLTPNTAGTAVAWSSNPVNALDEGSYVFTFVATDAAGRTSASATRTVVIDKTAPTGTFGLVSGTYVTGTTLGLSGTVSESTVAQVQVSVDGGAWATATSTNGSTSWSHSLDLSALTEGTHALRFRATDLAGNVTAAPYPATSFVLDQTNPTVAETTIASTDTRYTTSAPALAGAASDNVAFDKLTVTSAFTPAGTTVSSSTSTTTLLTAAGAWDYTVGALEGSASQGTYVLTFTASDKAGHTASVTRTVVVDSTAPSVAVTTDLTETWIATEGQTVAGSASDAGSGLVSVEYRVITSATPDPAWTAFSGTTNFSANVAFDSDGASNVLEVRATDKAGNVSTPVETGLRTRQTVKVDTVAPGIDSVDAPTSTPKVNGSTALQVTVTASDETSGVAGIGAAIGSKSFKSLSGTTPAPYVTTTKVSGSATAGGQWTVTVPAAALAACAEGTYTLYLKAFDAAGQASSAYTVTFVVDKTAPTVAFNTPADGATVNQTIALSGVAGDNGGLSSVSLAVYNGTTTTWESAGSAVGTTTWTLASFNTTGYSSAIYDADTATAGFQLKVRAQAIDEAGNVTQVTRTLLVDQDSDKPVVKLNNLLTTGSAVLKQTKEIYGSVSDDDGTVASLAVKEATGGWKTVTLDGTSFTYSLSGSDGSQSLSFKIVDAAGRTFETGTDPSPRTYALVAESKLAAGTSYTIYALGTTDFTAYGASSPAVGTTFVATRSGTAADTGTGTVYTTAAPYSESSVVFRLDTTNPDIGATVMADTKAAMTSAVALATGATYGGTASGSLYLSAEAWDANGIAALTATASGSVAGVTTTLSAAMALDSSATAATSGYSVFKNATALDLTKFDNGTVTITVTATDTSGLGSSVSKAVTVDNKAPTFTGIASPASGTVVNGSVTLSGGASDEGVGLASVAYQVGINADTSTTSAAWQTISADSLYSWTLAIDTSKYASATYATYNATNETWYLPIVFRITDKAGNTTVTTLGSYYLTINPDADRPTVALTYPTAADSPLGGTIRVYGTAADDDAVNAVFLQIDTNGDGVYDSSDTVSAVFDSTASTATTTVPSGNTAKLTIDWYNGGLGQKVSGTSNWSQKINTAGEFNPFTLNTTAGSATLTTTSNHGYAVGDKVYFAGSVPAGLVAGTVYYVSSVPTASTFTVATTSGGTAVTVSAASTGAVVSKAKNSTIHVRVRALDKTGDTTTSLSPAVYGPWAETTVTIDNNTPKIGSTTSLYLSQGTTTRDYADAMYISGDWTFQGSVEDETSLKEVRVESSSESALAFSKTITINPSTGAMSGADTSWLVQTTAGSSTSYNLALPLLTSSLTKKSGTIAFTVSATDNTDKTSTRTVSFYYDNEAPTGTYTGSLPVVQSDGTYEVGGTADDGSGSGIAKVEIYFARYTKGSTTNGRFYRPTADTTSSTSTSTSFTAPPTKTFSNGSAPYPSDGSYVLTVDYNGTETASAQDADGYLEKLKKASGSVYGWYMDLNSLSIPDGPLEVHYVVYDQAGNATHYVQTTTVANNAPTLSAYAVGTDLDGDGAVSSTEQGTFAASTVATGFVVKAAPMTLGVTVAGGNGTLVYSLASEAGTIRPLATAAGSFVVGQTYTIASVGTTSFTAVGASANTVGASFVATGAGSGSGTAYPTLRAGTGSLVPITLTSAEIASLSDDTHTFTVTVYDSTEETTPGADAQSFTKAFSTVFDLVDAVIPSAVLTPLYWNSSSSNSLYENSSANGHIELTSVVGSTGPDVSGKIKVEGTAFDDNRIAAVYLQIDGMTAAMTGYLTADTAYDVNGVASLTNESGTATSYYKVASFAGGTWTLATATVASQGWAFTAATTVLGQTGHSAAWELDWDTSKIATVAAKNVVVRLAVVDKSGNLSLRTVTTGNTPNLTVDVVPYIASLSRPTTVYRSRYGLYPVVKGETLTINGFNLYYSSGSSVTVLGTSANTADTAGTATGTAVTTLTNSTTTVTATVPAVSGYLKVITNGIGSQNNLDKNTAAYNSEADATNSDSALWNNDRYLRVWDNNHYFAGSDTSIHNPSLATDTTGNLFASWVEMGNADVVLSNGLYNASGSYLARPLYYGYDQPAAPTSLAINTKNTSTAANALGLAFLPDHEGSGGTPDSLAMADNRRIGGAGMIALTSAQGTSTTAFNSSKYVTISGNPYIILDGSTGSSYYPLASYSMKRDLGVFTTPRVARYGNAVHSVWYDSDTKALKYSGVDVSTESTSYNEANTVGWVVLDGGYSGQDRVQTSSILKYNTTVSTAVPAGTGPSSYSAGQSIVGSTGNSGTLTVQTATSTSSSTFTGTGAAYSSALIGQAPTSSTTASVALAVTSGTYWAPTSTTTLVAAGDTIALMTNASGVYTVELRTVTSATYASGTLTVNWTGAYGSTISYVTVYHGNLNVVGGSAVANINNLSPAATQSSAAGKYAAVDVTTGGIPVVAYYDTANDGLRLAYGVAAVASDKLAASWTRVVPGISGGSHVAMKIDGANVVHLVYRNSSGNLSYTYATFGSSTFATDLKNNVSVIDTSGNMTYATISTVYDGSSYTPVVSYLNSEETATAVKTAVQRTISGTKVWDIEIVPTVAGHYAVGENRIYVEGNNNAWSTTEDGVSMSTAQLAVAYQSDRFDVVILKKE